MIVLNYKKTFFLKSVSKISDIKMSYGIEVAFIGYSNSGKSSAINALTNQKKIARFSKMPGRTQLINFFKITSDFRIVDLPGYGYSQAPISIKLKWEKILFNYLEKRKNLKALVLLMDIRHPLKVFDYDIINISINLKIPILLLLTKCDKLTTSKQKIQFNSVCKKVKQFSNINRVILFSSLKKIGVQKLRLTLDNWYNQYCE
ncbi:YihA family ribosome biogenesis GTP-binding protein [Buchnera aphidicola (Melanaphis sacchari)]|uniref:Probable GTP-binding protein EngB n=1 Tax=Buchnera aphidicola (Melanaphis sacchari) TaxID=2173854 RepID=A0A2U8DEV7_9GAMM|nr:YihA family ribosome biogenesis GTP-binding protein [Buchnera aphidicola (Melanaphis sacchari)]